MKFRGADHDETIRDFRNDVKVFFSFRQFTTLFTSNSIRNIQKSHEFNLLAQRNYALLDFFLRPSPVSGTRSADSREREAEARGRDRAIL